MASLPEADLEYSKEQSFKLRIGRISSVTGLLLIAVGVAPGEAKFCMLCIALCYVD